MCHLLLPLHFLFRYVASEQAGGGKLTQTVAYHILGDVNRDMPTSIMDGNRMPNHLRENSAGAAPGTEYFLVTTLVHYLDFLQQFRVNKRPFFQ
jgi:hypothetical protein